MGNCLSIKSRVDTEQQASITLNDHGKSKQGPASANDSVHKEIEKTPDAFDLIIIGGGSEANSFSKALTFH